MFKALGVTALAAGAVAQVRMGRWVRGHMIVCLPCGALGRITALPDKKDTAAVRIALTDECGSKSEATAGRGSCNPACCPDFSLRQPCKAAMLPVSQPVQQSSFHGSSHIYCTGRGRNDSRATGLLPHLPSSSSAAHGLPPGSPTSPSTVSRSLSSLCITVPPISPHSALPACRILATSTAEWGQPLMPHPTNPAQMTTTGQTQQMS